MAVAAINGISIHFDDVGGGEDVVVLVHGHPFDRSMWAPQIAPLSQAGWRIIAADLRGYGQSDVVAGTTPFELFARDIALLLDHLGIASVVIGGLSMGGQIAMEFCRLYAGRVRGLILAATFPHAESDDGRRARNAMADRLLREGMDAYAEEFLPKMVGATTMSEKPDVAAHVSRMMRAAHRAGAAAALRGRAVRPEYESTLAALDVPALVVVGSEDAFTSRADADRMHALLRQSELVLPEKTGHMPNLERPSEFNAAVLRLLDRVRSHRRGGDCNVQDTYAHGSTTVCEAS